MGPVPWPNGARESACAPAAMDKNSWDNITATDQLARPTMYFSQVGRKYMHPVFGIIC